MIKVFLFLYMNSSLIASTQHAQEHLFPVNLEDQKEDNDKSQDMELTPKEEEEINKNIGDLSKLSKENPSY